MTQDIKNLPFLEKHDKNVFSIINQELHRQQNRIELIASENIASRAVMEAQGTVFTNKYAEGYSGDRYYGGCAYADEIEDLAIERAQKLYDANYVNVQPHSGSQANQAVFAALLKPHDTILGMSLSFGGHLTHGSKASVSGKWFNAVHYTTRESDGLLDYDEIQKLANEHQPQLIIAGASSYPRVIDFTKFRQIADSVGAYLLVDMAHYSGLIAAGVYPNPVAHADVVTTTTHKTLRGPRGGMILSSRPNIIVRKTLSGREITLAKAINSAVFPGIQGGPLMHVIAGKAVAYGEALENSFKTYGQNVISNAQTLAKILIQRGVDIVTGGTDSHIVLVDLRKKSVTGKIVCDELERIGITCNKNAIPFDPEKPNITSGIRLGTAAGTTRGFDIKDWEEIGNIIGDAIDSIAENGSIKTIDILEKRVQKLCNNYPLYS